MLRPTWNGRPVEHKDIPGFQPDAFETLRTAMAGPSVRRLTNDQLLHLVEAASHLELMIEWARLAAIPAARAGGASWAQLGAAMGVSRSTAQYRYDKAAKEWADDETARSHWSKTDPHVPHSRVPLSNSSSERLTHRKLMLQ